MMRHISITILHFGEISITSKCLDSLEKLNLPNIGLTVLVINNDLRVKFPENSPYKNFKLHVLNNKENNGFSGGHNQGFRFARRNKSDFHIVLNNDVYVDKDMITELLGCFKRWPTAGLVSPKIYFGKGDEFHKSKYKEEELGRVIWYAGGITDWDNLINHHRGVDEVDHGQYDDEEGETDFATGACFMIPMDLVQKVKGFDHRYFLYYEDGDLNMRIKRLGRKIIFCPQSIVWHRNAKSSGSGSALQDYYISRNRMLFGLTYAPLRTKIALFRESIKILLRGRRWQKRGIIDFYLRNFGKGSYSI